MKRLDKIAGDNRVLRKGEDGKVSFYYPADVIKKYVLSSQREKPCDRCGSNRLYLSPKEKKYIRAIEMKISYLEEKLLTSNSNGSNGYIQGELSALRWMVSTVKILEDKI
jgi:hypothetical protein